MTTSTTVTSSDDEAATDPEAQPEPGRASDDDPGAAADNAETAVGPEEADAGEDTEPVPRAPLWQRISAAAVVVLVICGAVAAGLLWRDSVHRHEVSSRNAQAVRAAENVVTELTTLKHGSLSKTVNSVLANTTGTFRNQFADSSNAFQTALTQGQVDSTGRVDSAGLIHGDGRSAEVLVAASSTVKNSQAPNGDARVYRMKVTLKRDAGKWLVENMEFVP